MGYLTQNLSPGLVKLCLLQQSNSLYGLTLQRNLIFSNIVMRISNIAYSELPVRPVHHCGKLFKNSLNIAMEISGFLLCGLANVVPVLLSNFEQI